MASVIAGISFGAAMGLLLTFFVTGSKAADRWSNIAFLAFYVAAGVVVYDVHQRYASQGAAVSVATVVALLALAILLVSQLLVLVGAIDFRRVAIPQTMGFAIYLLWILAASLFALAFGGHPGVAWLGIAAVAVSGAVLGWFARDPALIRGDRPLTRSESAVSALPFVGITAWLIALGIV